MRIHDMYATRSHVSHLVVCTENSAKGQQGFCRLVLRSTRCQQTPAKTDALVMTAKALLLSFPRTAFVYESCPIAATTPMTSSPADVEEMQTYTV